MSDKIQKVYELFRDYVNKTEYCGKVFIFGGYIRDRIIGIIPNDIDAILVGDTKDAMKLAMKLVSETKDMETRNLPVKINNAIRFYINDVRIDITSLPPIEGGTPRDVMCHAAIYHRDFAINGMCLNLENEEVFDGSGSSIKAIFQRSLVTARDDYDSIFYNHPARLYRMFRLQSKLNLTIPESQIEYARYKWWLSNFVERDRIKIEFDQIKQGPNAKKSLELLKYAKLDPTDLSRGDVFIQDGWHECEPGQEPKRYREGLHTRWTSPKANLLISPSVDAIELIYFKSEHAKSDILYYTINDKEDKIPLGPTSVIIPTAGGGRLTIRTNTFRPSDVFESDDTRELGLYVSKINIFKLGIKTEILIDYIPYHL